MNAFSKTLARTGAAAFAALALAAAFAPAAEARGRHGGHGHHGWHGHRHHHWGWGHHRPWYGPTYVGLYGGGCLVKRVRVYDPAIGAYVIVRRSFCG